MPTVRDRFGTPIGTVASVYDDPNTGRPRWMLVRGPGLLASGHLVPVAGAVLEDGGDITVPYERSLVLSAPRVDVTSLTPAQERRVETHYAAEQSARRQTAEASPPANRDLIRSEEELVVDTVERPAERVRLRKEIVTDEVTITVPVRREELRLERVPITDTDDVDDSVEGAVLGDAGTDITLLQEEVVVVGKRLVPRERVHLETEWVTETQEVSGEVRKERIVAETLPPPATPEGTP